MLVNRSSVNGSFFAAPSMHACMTGVLVCCCISAKIFSPGDTSILLASLPAKLIGLPLSGPILQRRHSSGFGWASVSSTLKFSPVSAYCCAARTAGSLSARRRFFFFNAFSWPFNPDNAAVLAAAMPTV